MCLKELNQEYKNKSDQIKHQQTEGVRLPIGFFIRVDSCAPVCQLFEPPENRQHDMLFPGKNPAHEIAQKGADPCGQQKLPDLDTVHKIIIYLQLVCSCRYESKGETNHSFVIKAQGL